MVNFVPLGERVIIQPIELDQQTKGGIFLPDTAKEKPQEGISPDPCLGVEALDSQMFGPPRSTADETPATVGTPEKLDEGISLTLPSLNVAEAEMVLIQRALEITQRNRTRAAELLGVSTRTLRNKLNKENPTPSGSA